MKMLVVLALAALAYAEPEAEANAALLYGAYGYAGYHPYASVYSGYRGYYGHPYTYGGYYGKRSADAEPEADADALYGYYGYARPYGGYYGGYRYGYAGYPYRYYGKRSADAEPEAEADPALLYTTSAVHHPVTSYVAGSPLLSSLVNTQVPVTSVNNVPVVQAAVKTVAHTPVGDNAAVPPPVVKTVAPHPFVYNTAVHTPVVNSVVNTLPLTHSLYNTLPVVSSAVPAATTTITKREAEADPALVYTGLTTPYVHHALPTVYNTAVHTPLVNTVYSAKTPVVSTVNTLPLSYAVPATTVAKAPAHGVAYTPAGVTHSANVGVCLNNNGVQVPC